VKRLAKRTWKWALPGLLAIDMFFNGLLFCGDFGQTISACWGQTYTVSALARAGCAVLDRIDPDHCVKAALGK
jgi:hypothetical protein